VRFLTLADPMAGVMRASEARVIAGPCTMASDVPYSNCEDSQGSQRIAFCYRVVLKRYHFTSSVHTAIVGSWAGFGPDSA